MNNSEIGNKNAILQLKKTIFHHSCMKLKKILLPIIEYYRIIILNIIIGSDIKIHNNLLL